MNAFQLSSTQTFRQGFTVEPIGLHPLSWSSGDHRWSGDQAPIPLSRQPIIQPVPRGSSLIGKGHLLIRKVVAYMVQQVLHFIRHAQGSDESLMTAKSCRDALFVHVQAGKHIILPGDKRLVSHLSASFGQCLLFQALYQSTRIENRHPSYKSYQDRPGNKEIQLSILYNAKRNLDVYADWQEYFHKQQPPTLITWGKNDGIFTVEGAELFKRDIPCAELHLLDTGHFALEEEVDRIGSLMHEFLDRTIKKK